MSSIVAVRAHRSALGWIRLGLIVPLLMTMTSCGKRAPDGSPGDAGMGSSGAVLHQLKKKDLTEAQLRYGIAPVPDSSVTYQPDAPTGGPIAVAVFLSVEHGEARRPKLTGAGADSSKNVGAQA